MAPGSNVNSAFCYPELWYQSQLHRFQGRILVSKSFIFWNSFYNSTCQTPRNASTASVCCV